jgi:hypothetical protein
MRKMQWILAAVLGAAFVTTPVALSGCAGTTRGQIRIVASTPPPPPRRVVVYSRPGYHWVQGYWVRYGSDWVWREGYWVRQRSGYDYVPGRWVQRQGRYYWIEPSWRRATVRRHDRAERRERPAPQRDVEIRDQRRERH